MPDDNDVLKEYETLVVPAEPTPPVEPDPTPAPDYDAQFKDIQAQYEEREAVNKQVIADQQAKLDRLEKLVQGAYAQAHPTPAPDTETEVKFTKEDLAKDAVGTIERVSEARSKRAVREYAEHMNPVLQNLVERGYQGEVALVSQKKYYPYVKDQLNQTFADNPQLKGQAGAVEYAYKMLVGENIEKIEEAIRKEGGPREPVDPDPEPPITPVPNRAAPTGRPGSPTPPAEPPPKGPELSPEQQRVKAKFAGIYKDMGLELTDHDIAGG